MSVDILSEVASMAAALKEYQRLDQAYLELFKLAGYDIDLEFEEENGTIKGRPKTVEELIRELLQDPPAEPAKYIRICDIPAYITKYLRVPAQDELDNFNTPVERQYHNMTYLEPVISAKYDLTGEEWDLASSIPNGVPVIDSRGLEYARVEGNKWGCLSTFDPARPDYETTEEVNMYRPFKGIVYTD